LSQLPYLSTSVFNKHVKHFIFNQLFFDFGVVKAFPFSVSGFTNIGRNPVSVALEGRGLNHVKKISYFKGYLLLGLLLMMVL
jgi:hypothetical protein